METFEFIVFTLVLASCTWLGLTTIWQSKEISKLKERVRSEKKPMYNVWLSSLSNNLPYFFDNPHGKETKGKKCPFDLDLYHLDFVKEARIVENEKLENEVKKLKIEAEEYSKAAKYWKNQYDFKPYEKNLELSLQKQQFEEKEKKYVEKIRQLEKILADTEKRRTEAYELIDNVYMFKDTVLLDYGRYRAEEIDLSEFEKELEITFKNYCRQEKIIKEKSK